MTNNTGRNLLQKYANLYDPGKIIVVTTTNNLGSPYHKAQGVPNVKGTHFVLRKLVRHMEITVVSVTTNSIIDCLLLKQNVTLFLTL